MPRHPDVTQRIAAMPTSVYSALAHRLSKYSGEIYPLHVGDTWMEPAQGCRMQDLTVADHPGMHKYAPVQGLPALIDGVVAQVTDRSGLSVERDEVLITPGATPGLATIANAIVAPGDEVLILAPFWPLIAGLVRAIGGTPVPVPFFGTVTDRASAMATLEAARTAQTVALYINTPHNPSGGLIPGDWLQDMASWARKHDLWILADEVYEHYAFEGEHVHTRPFAPERTFSVHSFSKAYGMAGNRCGYIVGPKATMAELRKVATNSFYSTPRASQLAAINALNGAGDAWAAKAAIQYAETGKKAAARLGLPAPKGSTFLFFDIANSLEDDGLDGVLTKCVESGLLVAPGPSFGPYPTHIRLCYTAADPERVLRGVEILAKILGR